MCRVYRLCIAWPIENTVTLFVQSCLEFKVIVKGYVSASVSIRCGSRYLKGRMIQASWQPTPVHSTERNSPPTVMQANVSQASDTDFGELLKVRFNPTSVDSGGVCRRETCQSGGFRAVWKRFSGARNKGCDVVEWAGLNSLIFRWNLIWFHVHWLFFHEIVFKINYSRRKIRKTCFEWESIKFDKRDNPQGRLGQVRHLQSSTQKG